MARCCRCCWWRRARGPPLVDAAQSNSNNGFPSLRSASSEAVPPPPPAGSSSSALPEGVPVRRRSFDYRALLPERFEVDVENRYVLDKMAFSEGGYGKVFVARDRAFDQRRVAVKQVTKTKDTQQTQSFYDEIKIMKDLDHPHICKLFETIETGRHIFFVMEFCEGGEVFSRIVEEGIISEAIVAEVIAQVAAALRYAHGRSIAHRDVKPENILFCTKNRDDHRIKVIDWGLSVCFNGEVMRTAVGSTTYSAPEVLKSRNLHSYTSACDLWSLGVVAYVMLCGKPPFWGSFQQHLDAALAERYPLAEPPWDSISEPAKDFVRGLLRAEPGKRYTMEQVLAHPWLRAGERPSDVQATADVLRNLRSFSGMHKFVAMCTAAVARQLDHSHLRSIHDIFCEMDQNSDGVLSFDEIAQGFRRIFSEDSPEYRQVERTFRSLDLDGSGSIDYTEFCAAALGKHAMDKDDAVWAAFKTFDRDNDGRLSKADIQAILGSAHVQGAWSPEVCQDAGRKVMERFKKDGDGKIEFDEWMGIMRKMLHRRRTALPPLSDPVDLESQADDELSWFGCATPTPQRAYTMLRGTSEPASKALLQQGHNKVERGGSSSF